MQSGHLRLSSPRGVFNSCYRQGANSHRFAGFDAIFFQNGLTLVRYESLHNFPNSAEYRRLR